MVWQLQKANEKETESKVLALLCDGPCRLIATFSSNLEAPQSLESRIVSSFSHLQTGDQNSFASKAVTKKRIVEAVEEVWNSGSFAQDDIGVDSILRISTRKDRLIGELINERELYDLFCSLLKSLDQLLTLEDGFSSPAAPGGKFINFGNIIYREPLRSYRGTSTKASVALVPREIWVYKGVSFYDLLLYGPDGFRHQLDACYREIRMINRIIPPHPNIISPPDAFAVVDSKLDGMSTQLVCGSLYPYYKGGSLADVLDRSVKERTRISLYRKAKWCYQLCSGMVHVHFQAHSWHQDIKPPNLLLDNDDNLLIIDWEQCGANSFILAPEADGSFDVTVTDCGMGEPCRLIYARYDGSRRVNNPIGTPEWNVFPTWKAECPRAAELAEVYSLGRTIWLLLEQVGLDHVDGVEDYSSEVVHWTDWSEDIPQSWKNTVAACVKQDPNERMPMRELSDFWKTESKELGFAGD